MGEVTMVNNVETEIKVVKSSRNDLLKIFAMLTMLIDHIGHMQLVHGSTNTLFRTIGRLAFPIFAYQVAVGYSKTSNRKKYAGRLAIFAIISQIPYFFFNPALKFNGYHFNIMFLLLTGIGIINLYETGKKYFVKYKENKHWKNLSASVLIHLSVVLALILPEIIQAILWETKKIDFSFEYGFYGLLMVLLFHIFRERKLLMLLSYIILSLVGAYLNSAWVLVYWGRRFIGKNVNLLEALSFKNCFKMLIRHKDYLRLDGRWFQSRSIFAILIIYVLNWVNNTPKIKVKLKLNKYIGYSFYPVHITILILIAYFMK